MIYGYISLAILNWNGIDDTIDCVSSIMKSSYPYFHVFLIDNGSSLEEITQLKKLYEKNEKITLIFNNENLGFAGGTNVGIRESLKNNSEFTLLLNNDTVVDPLFLEKLVETSRKDNAIGIVTSRVYYHKEPNVIWSSGSYFNYFFPPFSKEYKGDEEVEVTDVTGCSMLVRNKVFEKIGLLDEDYFAYGEESDFNIRARKAGFKLFVSPQSKIWHKVSRSTGGGFNKIVAYYKMRNKIKLAQKNYSLVQWIPYSFFLALYFLKELLKSLLKRRFDVSESLITGVKDAVTNQSSVYEKKKKILDVGCGQGGNAYYLSRDKNNTVIGIDLSEEIVASARKKHPEIEFQVMSIEDLQFPDKTFDEVYAMDVLEHVDNLDKSIQEVTRVLKTQGKFIINIPAEKSEAWLLKLRPSYFDEIHHVRIFKGDDLKNSMQRYRYRMQKKEPMGFLDHISLYYQFTRKRQTNTQLGIGTWEDSFVSKIIFVVLLFFRPHVLRTPLKFFPIWIVTLPIGMIVSFIGNKFFPKSIYYIFVKES